MSRGNCLYVHLNPLSIIEKEWKINGIINKKEAEKFLKEYTFSSYQDFLGIDRPEKAILDFSHIPEYIKNMELNFKTFEKTFKINTEN